MSRSQKQERVCMLKYKSHNTVKSIFECLVLALNSKCLVLESSLLAFRYISGIYRVCIQGHWRSQESGVCIHLNGSLLSLLVHITV